MSSLVRRIQISILGGGNGGSADYEHLRSLLRELQIPAGRTPQPDALARVRRALLYSGASESYLRDALAGLGLSGSVGGDKAKALADIRRAILHNL